MTSFGSSWGPNIHVWPSGNRCHLLGTFFDLLRTLSDISGALLDLPGTLFDLLRTFSDLLGPWFGLPGMLSDGEYWSFFHWNHGCIYHSVVTHLVMLSCNAFKSMKYVGTFIITTILQYKTCNSSVTYWFIKKQIEWPPIFTSLILEFQADSEWCSTYFCSIIFITVWYVKSKHQAAEICHFHLYWV